MISTLLKYAKKSIDERFIQTPENESENTTPNRSDHIKDNEVIDDSGDILLEEASVSESFIDENVRSVVGKISSISDGVFFINVAEVERIATKEMCKINLIEGDTVKVNGIVSDEGFGHEGYFQITSLDALQKKEEFGRVTLSNKEFVVFEENILMLPEAVSNFSAVDLEQVQLHQEFKLSSIETDQTKGGKHYSRRVVEIFEKVDNTKSCSEIAMNDTVLRVPQCGSKIEQRFIKIVNKTNEIIRLIKCQFNANSDSVTIERPGFPSMKPIYSLRPKEAYEARLNIFPRIAGTTVLTFTAEFRAANNEPIQKHCEVSIEVYNIERNVFSANRDKAPLRFVDIRFKDFFVSANLREIDFTKKTKAIENLEKSFPFIVVDEITRHNFKDKVQIGLWLNEIAMEMAFKGYQIPKGRFENKEDCLRLEVKDVNEKRPSLMIGDAVEVTDPHRLNDRDRPIFRGFIQKVEDDAILIKFRDGFHLTHNNKDYLINFFFSRTCYKQQHHALERILSGRSFGLETLFPEIAKVKSRNHQIYVTLEDGKLKMFGRELKWFDNKLNLYQKQAVVNTLQGECRPLPYVIYGPPGTGKTMTVVELIKQLFFLDPTTHLIVATPSNSAANLFTQALIDSELFQKPHDFIRFVSNIQIEKELIPDYLQRYCGTISIDGQNSRNQDQSFYTEAGIRKGCTKQTIMNYRICIATLSCLGSLMQIKFPCDHFTHVIIDEAGQSTEAEALIPVTLLSKHHGQIVLAGDPKQLGPIMLSRFAKNFQLETSMLERLLKQNDCYAQVYGPERNEFDPRFVTRLKINYRSVPSVLKIYNDLFYKSELEGAVSDDTSSEAVLLTILEDILWNQDKANKKCGIYSVNVAKGRNRKTRDSCSWFNEEEISEILSFLSKISQSKISFTDVGVITPYALQVKRLKHKVSVGLTDTDLKIGTVEEFQGQERQIILVSTVRTDEKHLNTDKRFGLGFLQCQKRMNVAISRARALMVVFGKEAVLEKDENWKELIDFTKDNKTFVDLKN